MSHQHDTNHQHNPDNPVAGPLSRRTVVAGTGIVAAAAAVAACSSYGGSQAPTGGTGAGQPSAQGTPSVGKGETLATTSQIPVGGGQVFKAQQVVVTQPEAGTFKGFSAICTHNQCTVGKVADGTIDCPCHGSKFAIADGSVVRPANPNKKQAPLPPREIVVEGNTIRLA